MIGDDHFHRDPERFRVIGDGEVGRDFRRRRRSKGRSFRTAEIRTRSERESEMLRGVLNAWVTQTTAAEILANPATRRRQVTMTISLNPLRSTR